MRTIAIAFMACFAAAFALGASGDYSKPSQLAWKIHNDTIDYAREKERGRFSDEELARMFPYANTRASVREVSAARSKLRNAVSSVEYSAATNLAGYGRCSNLKMFGDAPNAVSVEANAFNHSWADPEGDYTGVEKVGAMPNVRTIGEGAFRDNAKFQSHGIGREVVEVGQSAFLNCFALDNDIDFPQCETLGVTAFKGYGTLTYPAVGDMNALTNAMTGAFSESGIIKTGDFKSLEIKNTGSSPYFSSGNGYYMFENCDSLREVGSFPKAEMFANYMFSGCEQLEKIGRCGKMKFLSELDDTAVSTIGTDGNFQNVETLDMVDVSIMKHLASISLPNATNWYSGFVPGTWAPVCSNLTYVSLPRELFDANATRKNGRLKTLAGMLGVDEAAISNIWNYKFGENE